MTAEARRREYKRLWTRVQRRTSKMNVGHPSTVPDSETFNMSHNDTDLQNTSGKSDGDMNEMSFHNTSINDTIVVDTGNMDPETFDSDMDTVSLENSDNNEMATDNLAEEFKKWISVYNIKHNAADALLKILRDQGHEDLPSTAKTLLKTKRIESQMVSGVECVNFGVMEQLITCLNRYPCDVIDITEIEVSLNVDGLPLFKSTCKSFWPVLCTVHL